MERELIELLENKNGRVRTKVMREFKERVGGTWDDVKRKVNCAGYLDEYVHTINYLKRKENNPEDPRTITIDEVLEYLKTYKDRRGTQSHLRLYPHEAEQVLEWLTDYQKIKEEST